MVILHLMVQLMQLTVVQQQHLEFILITMIIVQILLTKIL